jgi:hypothetical protein
MKVALMIALVAASGQPEAFRHERADELLAFSYGWPAMVAEEPALRAILAAEMTAAETEARDTARDDRDRRSSSDFPFNRHEYSKVWTLAGSTPHLLSLAAGVETYSGGAHGGLTFATMLWDRTGNREVDPATILGATALARLTPRYCNALNLERSARRGEPVTPDASDSFTACPPLSELLLAPADLDGNSRFDALEVLIAPYVAGPWVEGPYPITVAFEQEDLAGINESRRSDFEPAATPLPTD